MTGYQTGILVLLSLNVVAAYSIFLPLSAGQLNLGIAGFMAIGAYASAYFTNEFGWPILPAILIGGTMAGAAALLVASLILRTQGIYHSLVTFALGQVITAAFLNLEVVGAAAGYPVRAFAPVGMVVATAALVVLLVFLLWRTRFALYMTAIKSDAVIADLMGINVRGLQTATFAIGAAIAGVGGGLYAHHFSFVEAQYFGFLLSIYTALYVLLGGTQTVWGPLVGAGVFTLLPELLRASSHWRYALFAVFVILFMALRPEGLVTASLLGRLVGHRRKARG